MMPEISFDPEWACPADWARMYRQAGLQVVPARFPMKTRDDKRPALADWREFQREQVDEAIFAKWFPADAKPNMGTITGAASGNLLVIDLDEYKSPEAALWFDQAMFGIRPETWMQQTGGGGRQWFFRLPDGVTIGNCRTALGVDIRGQGGFAMLPPSRHMSGNSYAWSDGHEPWCIDLDTAPQHLIDAVYALIEEHGGTTTPAARERVAAEQDHDAWGHLVDGREEYMRSVVWARVVDLKREHATPPTGEALEAEIAEAYQIYERKVRSRLAGPDPLAIKLEREGRGFTVFSDKFRHALRQWDAKVAEAALVPKLVEYEGPKTSPPDATEEPKPSVGVIPLVSAFPIDAAAIEPRDWNIPGLLLRKHLSVLVAPPGSGKSLLTLQIAIAGTVGMNWGGWTVRKPTKTLVINAEDDIDEMRRRLWAAAETMGVDPASLSGRLFLAEAPESIVISKLDAREKVVVRTPLHATLVETVCANDIGQLIVDPFAETFEGDENSNSEVKWAGVHWREIARKTGASVLLVHHTKKYAGAMAGDMDASRGGGSLIGVARIISTLFAMTEDEAAAMNIDPEQRTRYVRFDDAKANLSLITGAAKWFQKISVGLPNARGLIPGDEVGVLAPWKPPGLMDGFSTSTINLCLDAINRGPLGQDGEMTGARFTAHGNGKDKSRWAGSKIAEVLGSDAEVAKRILKTWLDSGLLYEVTYHDGKQERKGLAVDDAKRPGAPS